MEGGSRRAYTALPCCPLTFPCSPLSLPFSPLLSSPDTIGEGAKALAEAVVKAAEQPSDFSFLYDVNLSIEEKIETICKEVYRASGISISGAYLRSSVCVAHGLIVGPGVIAAPGLVACDLPRATRVPFPLCPE